MVVKTKGLVDLLAGNIVFRSLNIVCTILITFLLTRAMGAGGFGSLSLLVANAALLNLLTCLGAESGITYHYSSGSLPKRSLTSLAYLVILFQVAIMLLTEVVYHLYTGHYLLAEEGKGMSLLLAGVVYFISIAVIDKYQAFFNAAHLYNLAARVIFFVNLLSLIVYAYYHYAITDAPASSFLLIFIVSSAFQAILMVVLFHYYTKQPLRFGRPGRTEWKLFFSYSALVLITNIIQFLAYRIDYWLIDYYQGKEQLGLYSLAVRLGQLLWVLPLLMAGILFPRVAGNTGEEEERKWLSLIRIGNLLFLVMAIVAAVSSFWLIPVFAGIEFRESVLPFIYLLPGLLFFWFNIIFAAYFAGKGKLKINLAGSCLCLVLVLAGDLLLIPHFGIKGAAIASSIAYTAAGIHHLSRFVLYKRIPVLSVLMINSDDWKTVRHYLKKYTGRK